MKQLPDELERLGQALALNEGFQIVLLECDGLDSWGLHRIFDLVQARVAELRGVAPLVIVYDPHVTTDEEGALRDEAWVEGVLGSILKLPAPSDDGASLVAVIDGSAAARPDGNELRSWTFLFHRLNERRNVIARTLVGTLALALPRPLVGLFLSEAADSASIRSGVFRLDGSMVPADTSARPRFVEGTYPDALVMEATLRRHAADPRLEPERRSRARAALASPEIALPLLSASRPGPTRGTGPEVAASPHEALYRLLLSLFSADELRRFLRYLPDGDELSRELPGGTASSAQLVSDAVDVLESRGLLGDPDFWARLRSERPRRRHELEQVRQHFAAANKSQPAPTSSFALGVLLISVGKGASRQVLGRPQLHGVEASLMSSLNRDRIRLEHVRVAGYDEIWPALRRSRPQILVVSSEGDTLSPQGASFSRLLSMMSDSLRLVIIHAPEAFALASQAAKFIDLAISIEGPIADLAWIAFLTNFFQRLRNGDSVEEAFTTARSGALVFEAPIQMSLLDARHRRGEPLL